LSSYSYVKFFSFIINFSFSKLASVINEQNDFIYRLETDTQSGNLTGVIDFCSELGGYPIYANNAYEWQLIQGKHLSRYINSYSNYRQSIFIINKFLIRKNRKSFERIYQQKKQDSDTRKFKHFQIFSSIFQPRENDD
jgi:hypothetical protein